MANSQRFRELRNRLRELRQRMLPTGFSPTGTYSNRQLDRARGYRLLVHAEIEAFIEDIAREAVRAKIAAWKNNRKPSEVIVSLLASYHAGFGAGADDDTTLQLSSRTLIKDRVDEAVDLATTQFLRKLTENHGIRQENLRKLLLPVGVEVDKLVQRY